MLKWFIVLVLAICLIGWVTPLLRRIGLGRLPGDIHFVRNGKEYNFPFATSLHPIGVAELAGVASSLKLAISRQLFSVIVRGIRQRLRDSMDTRRVDRIGDVRRIAATAGNRARVDVPGGGKRFSQAIRRWVGERFVAQPAVKIAAAGLQQKLEALGPT